MMGLKRLEMVFPINLPVCAYFSDQKRMTLRELFPSFLSSLISRRDSLSTSVAQVSASRTYVHPNVNSG